MDSGRQDGQKTGGLGQDEGPQVVQKDDTTSIDTAGDEDRKTKKGSDMNSSENRVSLGFVDEDFIRQLVPS